MDIQNDTLKYRESLLEKIVPIMDDLILTQIKIDQLKQNGISRNHFNKSHFEMVDKLDSEKFSINQRILTFLQTPTSND